MITCRFKKITPSAKQEERVITAVTLFLVEVARTQLHASKSLGILNHTLGRDTWGDQKIKIQQGEHIIFASVHIAFLAKISLIQNIS
jgi:hypothetical protein